VSAVLLAVLRPQPHDVDDFFAWYEAEHVTGRLAMPGFRNAHRYVCEDDSEPGLLIYELDELGALSTEEYRELQAGTATTTQARMGALRQFVRVSGRVIQEHGEGSGPSPLIFVVAFAVPEQDLDELDSWYQEEHAPMLLKNQAWCGIRLVDVRESTTAWTRMAIHRLADVSALTSPERRAAGQTPRRHELGMKAWFSGGTRYTARAVESLHPVSPGR
jgi:hypothetical protein